tara:strand:+ start:36 stop:860 length:825 start_codon:yes stop_codon:yes gene_type:complete
MIIVPLTANDGTKNRIDLNAPIPVWSTLINEPDASKRWFPLPAFENVELPKADSQFEEANSGRMAFLRQGKRSFSGELWSEDSTPTFLGKLEKTRCVDFGVYFIDVNGNLIGSEVDGYLYPIAVDSPSWNPTFMFATDSTVQKIMLAFDVNRLFDESTMYMITGDEAGVDFTTLDGLVDVVLTVVGTVGQALTTLNAEFCYGTAFNKIDYVGATNPTDWSITDGVTIFAPDAVTETADGVYVLDYTTQGFGAGVPLTFNVSRVGFIGEVAGVTV